MHDIKIARNIKQNVDLQWKWNVVAETCKSGPISWNLALYFLPGWTEKGEYLIGLSFKILNAIFSHWRTSKWWISHFKMHSVWQQLRSAVANCQVQMVYSIINNHKYYREFLWDIGTRSGAGDSSETVWSCSSSCC